jgi:hypothetical protein
LTTGDDIRAFIPLDRRAVVLDVFVDGDFAMQLEMPWRTAAAVASESSTPPWPSNEANVSWSRSASGLRP